MPKESRTVGTCELRGLMNRDLLQAADVFAQRADMTRIQWVEKLIEREVESKLHDLRLQNRMLRGNPLLSDSSDKHADASDK